jgi:uncharacterized protein (DUF1501 family)
VTRCCEDFARTALLRRSVAQAGRGLPVIEPGMPLPAGTGLSRRSFVARSLGLALAVYGGGALGPRLFEDGIAYAAGAPKTVFVSVFLDGGADALSVLFPAGDPLYPQLRRRLRLDPAKAVRLTDDDRLWWHPSLGPLAALHAEGKVTVIPAIGYTDANQSHFTSRHFWEVGATDERLQTGWLGRTIDRIGRPDNPLQGLSLDSRLQPSLATARMPVASIDAPDSYDFWARGVWGEVEQRMLDAARAFGRIPHGGDPGLAAATDVVRQSMQLYRELVPFRPKEGRHGISSRVTYPHSEDAFPRRLAGLAAMIAAGLPLRLVALSAPGSYDTHADQPKDLADNLQLTAASLFSFQRDLEARGIADRVLVHVWSEFGRRAKENGSSGTDHGAAGVGFLIGARVTGGMIGEFPGLAKLDDDGNLVATADYRGLYRAILEDWVGADADAIIPNARRFTRPTILRT